MRASIRASVDYEVDDHEVDIVKYANGLIDPRSHVSWPNAFAGLGMRATSRCKGTGMSILIGLEAVGRRKGLTAQMNNLRPPQRDTVSLQASSPPSSSKIDHRLDNRTGQLPNVWSSRRQAAISSSTSDAKCIECT